MRHATAASAAGVATFGLVGAASALAWRDGSPLVPREAGLAGQGSAWLFLILLVAAFATYVGDAHTAIARFNSVLVLTLQGNRISGLTRFGDTGILPAFGLPRVLR